MRFKVGYFTMIIRLKSDFIDIETIRDLWMGTRNSSKSGAQNQSIADLVAKFSTNPDRTSV